MSPTHPSPPHRWLSHTWPRTSVGAVPTGTEARAHSGNRSRHRPPAVLRLPAHTNPCRPPLIAVPGLGLSVEVPARTLRLLQPAHESTVVALPGYGSPYEPGTALDPAALAARLLQHPETRRASRAILLGHSASCQIVAEAAVQDPARVAGLILVGPTTDPRAASWSALAARWLRTAAWERPFQVPVLVRDYRHTGLTTMGRAMDAARRHRIDHPLRQVSCPVLVVRGRHDRIAPADWTAALAELTPHGRAVTLTEGAHMVPITHPATLAGHLEAAVSRM
jgi:pimeloyl-ACP methyl ester carboxylesterase